MVSLLAAAAAKPDTACNANPPPPSPPPPPPSSLFMLLVASEPLAIPRPWRCVRELVSVGCKYDRRNSWRVLIETRAEIFRVRSCMQEMEIEIL